MAAGQQQHQQQQQLLYHQLLPQQQQQQLQQQQPKVNFREKEKQILDKILGPGHYDRRIRPAGANGTGELFRISR